MHHREITRRTMLRGMGVAMALPMLEAMSVGKAAWGAAGPMTVPKRLAFFFVPNGMHMPDWTPRQTGTEFELPPILNELADFRDKLNVLSGLALNGARALGDGPGDHARAVAAFLTGAHPRKTNGSDILNGMSVDQLAAAAIGNATRLPSLELGTEASAQAGNCDSGYSCVYTSNMSWRTDVSPVAKEVDPALVFDRMFAGSDWALSPEERARRDRRRRSILDLAHEDAQNLHRALGANDRRKLDEYLYAVREIEQRLQRTEKLDPTDADVVENSRPTGVPRQYSEHVKLLMDMLVLAFQTDTTRIATFMFANAGSNRGYREIGISDGHHDLSHHGNSEEKQVRISQINRYHASLFRHFLARLDAIPEGEGSLLDQCLIMYGSGISDGNAHNHDNLPILLAGGGGGSIATGRHLKFRRETPLTNLYCTLLNQMGVDVDQFSDSTGKLPL
ncbi:MAG TPA: DUF1552 domain-containing protein [Pirellulaceae bacterium]|nr:DUF1552 domain-containing protein [Pirellulaceae bacterium]